MTQNMTQRVWVLGAPDPEMEMIEALLRDAGETVVFAAVSPDGDFFAREASRVHPGNTYHANALVDGAGDVVRLQGSHKDLPTVYQVECDGPAIRRCLMCGEVPDPARPGRSVLDGEFHGEAPCGDMHLFPEVVTIDHHRPGDPGYGRPPAEFLPASSIGQILSELARSKVPLKDLLGPYPYQGRYRTTGAGRYDPPIFDDEDGWNHHWTLQAWNGFQGVSTFTIPEDVLLTAAADHCLAAAYAGECPEVHPDALMRWRVETRAAHQGRSPEAILADIEAARETLDDAPLVRVSAEPWVAACGTHGRTGMCHQSGHPDPGRHTLACYAQGDTLLVRDMRGQHVPELPEAAAREGVAYLATVADRDGRKKVVLGGAAAPEVVKAFMESWAPAQGLTDIYGDPARGFAGGYLPAE